MTLLSLDRNQLHSVILRSASVTLRFILVCRSVPHVTCRANSFQKVISFSLFAGPASFLLISLKHLGCEELIGRAVLWERVATTLGQGMWK